MQECVYQDYGPAKDAGWEPGDYVGLRSQAAGLVPATGAGKPGGAHTGGHPSGAPTGQLPKQQGGGGSMSGAAN